MEGFKVLNDDQKAMQADCVNATADYFMTLIRSGKSNDQIRTELVKNMQALLQAQLDELQGK